MCVKMQQLAFPHLADNRGEGGQKMPRVPRLWGILGSGFLPDIFGWFYRAGVDTQQSIEAAPARDTCYQRDQPEPAPGRLGSPEGQRDDETSDQDADGAIQQTFIGFHDVFLWLIDHIIHVPWPTICLWPDSPSIGWWDACRHFP